MGPGSVTVKARLGQVGDKVSRGFVYQVGDHVSQVKDLVGLVNARARSLTIILTLHFTGGWQIPPPPQILDCS